MKKITSIALMLILLFSIVGCSEEGKKETTNKKTTFNETITKITVDNCGGREKHQLSDEKMEKVVGIFKDTINNSKGETYDQIADEFVNGGFELIFYNEKDQIQGLGLNGKYCIYMGRYYKMSENDNNELSDVLEESTKASLGDITNVCVYTGGCVNVTFEFLNDEAKEQLINIMKETISKSDTISEKEYKEQIYYGGKAFYFYNNSKELTDISINNKVIVYNSRYYKMSDKDYKSLNALVNENNYYPEVYAEVKKADDNVLTVDVTKSTNNLKGTYEIEIGDNTIEEFTYNDDGEVINAEVGDEIRFVYDGTMTKCLTSKIFPIYIEY